jgi:nitroreductase
MNKTTVVMVVAIVLVTAIAITTMFSLLISHKPEPAEPAEKKCIGVKKIEVGERIKHPEPIYKSNISVEEALSKRRSIRTYSDENLTIEEVSQLLWAAHGITSPRGGRTAPSADALYPLELYLIVGDVDGFDKGVYKYRPEEHELEKVVDGDKRGELAEAAVGPNQEHVRDAAIEKTKSEDLENIPHPHTLVITTSTVASRQWRDELLDKTDLDKDTIGEYSAERKEIKTITIATY